MPDQLLKFWNKAGDDTLRILFDHAPIMMHVTDDAGRTADVSQFLADCLGMGRSALQGCDPHEFMTAASTLSLRKIMKPRLRAEGHLTNEAANLVRRDGSILPVRISASSVRDEAGRPVRTLAVLLDDSRAQRSAALLDLALDTIPEAFVIFDEDDRLVRCNAAYRNLYALSAPAILTGASFESILRYGLKHGQYPAAGETEESREAWFAERMRAHRSADTEINQMIGRDQWLLISEKRTPSGQTVGIRKDISALRSARSEAERLGRILEHCSHEVYAARISDMRFEIVNEAARRNLQYSMEELAALTPIDISTEFRPDTELHRRIGELIAGGCAPFTIRSEHRRKDGTTYPCELRLEVERGGAEPLLVAFCEDITDRIALEGALAARNRELEAKNDALQAAVEEAERASRSKSIFLANMSHEIRTPLNGVLGMATALSQSGLSDAQSRMTDVILGSGKQLLTLLNDVLDLAKIEAGEISLEVETVCAQDILTETSALFDTQAAAKGLTIDYAVPRRAQGSFIANAKRVRQVMANLVSNAVKFTDTGTIMLSTEVHPHRQENRAILKFAVTDTGPGVPDALKEAIFGRFEQGDGRDNAVQGTGLGLSIARTICHLHGGNLTLEDAPGGGARFMASFDVGIAAESGLIVQRQNPADRLARLDRELRILVAEDNEMNQQVLTALLQIAPSVEPVFVKNGAAALDLLETGPFDAGLIDIRMPVMNGLEMIRIYREKQLRRGASLIPMIACSANVMTDQIAEYTASGFDSHLAKPVELDKLADCIEWIAAQAGTAHDDRKILSA